MQQSKVKNSDLFQLLKQPLDEDLQIQKELQDVLQKKAQVNDGLYIYSSSYKALCCFYIAAFMTQQFQENKNVFEKLKENMFQLKSQNVQSKKESQQLFSTFLKKFQLNLQENTDLIQLILKKQYSMNTNRLLFEKACQQLDVEECNKKVRSLANYITISTYFYKEKLVTVKVNKNSKYAVLLVEKKQRSFLFILSISPINPQGQSPNKSALKSEKPEKYTRISTSSQEEQKHNNKDKSKDKEKEKDKDKGKKGKNQKSKVQSTNNQEIQKKVQENANLKQSNQFTWFQGLVLIIIVLAVLSHFFGIFDEQIIHYNQQKGNYYLIQTGYAITSYISQTYQSLFP